MTARYQIRGVIHVMAEKLGHRRYLELDRKLVGNVETIASPAEPVIRRRKSPGCGMLKTFGEVSSDLGAVSISGDSLLDPAQLIGIVKHGFLG